MKVAAKSVTSGSRENTLFIVVGQVIFLGEPASLI